MGPRWRKQTGFNWWPVRVRHGEGAEDEDKEEEEEKEEKEEEKEEEKKEEKKQEEESCDLFPKHLANSETGSDSLAVLKHCALSWGTSWGSTAEANWGNTYTRHGATLSLSLTDIPPCAGVRWAWNYSRLNNTALFSSSPIHRHACQRRKGKNPWNVSICPIYSRAWSRDRGWDVVSIQWQFEHQVAH